MWPEQMACLVATQAICCDRLATVVPDVKVRMTASVLL